MAVPPSAGPVPGTELGISLGGVGVTAGAELLVTGGFAAGADVDEEDFPSQPDKAMSATTRLADVCSSFMAIPNDDDIKFDPVWVGFF
jgi:hypothetical protein